MIPPARAPRRAAAALAAACLAAGAAAAPCAAQTAAPADSFLHQYAATYRFRLGRPTAIQVAPAGDAVLFLRSEPRSFVQDLYSFDPATGGERVLLTAEQILSGAEEKLSAGEKARRERMRLAARGIASYQLSKDGTRLLVPLAGRLFVIERAGGAVTELKAAAGALDPRFSPDARQVACVRDGDLYAIDVATGAECRLTTRENAEVSYGEAEFVAQEEMDRFHGFWWSPDGRTLACQRTDVSLVEKFHVADPVHPERAPDSWAYPRPGRANAEVRLLLIPAAGGPATEVRWDRGRYPYLATVTWEEHAPLTLLVQDREQAGEVLLAVDETSGATRPLLGETDGAWLNLDPEMPRWLEDGSGFLWTSEREGEWKLELRARDGRLLRALTPAGFGYRGLAELDARRGVAWVRASADPTEAHLWRVSLDPKRGRPERMTRESGLHGAVFSKGHELWVHTLDGLAGERRQTVTRRDGRALGDLRSVAESPHAPPNLELTTAGDSLVFHAAIVRPRDFDPRRRYPVLVEVYGGPHAQMALAARSRYVLDQWFADRGFVVVMLDGRGTPGRGRAWERALRGSFIAVPLADQVAGLRALGAKYPELDLERAGIFGWSYGGYATAMAVLRRPDVFKAGVAGAPVTDWHDYDTHYTERYIGLPDAHPGAYEESSVLASAKELVRPLLVIHGTDDDNVYFMHGIKLCDALYRAGRPFEFLPLTGFTHMVADPLVTERLERRIADFFILHLGGPR
ncbi:MAG: DPP IV N-terminal domain-containing protein [Candidatus Eisenbacteria bacterium]|nr:DPP IV N-terminal domain-containing protein [Candidatus Eisenbacteria bacterium]